MIILYNEDIERIKAGDKMKQREFERQRRLRQSLPRMQGDYYLPQDAQIKSERQNPWLMLVSLLVVLACFIVFNLNFLIIRVDGHSMDPTLHHGQYLLVKKHEPVKRFEIAILNECLADKAPKKMIVKRIIGLAGDKITVIKGKLYINDKECVERYLVKKNVNDFNRLDWTIKVPKGYVFVLGDNRDISKDSRSVGCFKKDAIVGVKI